MTSSPCPPHRDIETRVETDSQQEAEWARRAIEGDVHAMELIYLRYKTMAFAVGVALCGNASDADDVVQETFLRAFRKLAQWGGEGSLGSWLYSVAYRTAQNWKSRFHRKPAIPHAREPRDLESRANHEELLAAIETLPEQQRLTVTLKHIRGLRIREIAEILGCADGTVKANLHHAITKLSKRFGEGA